MAGKKHVRLSPDVVPSKYEVHIRPDLEAFVFEGDETIYLTFKKPLRTITLHSKDLEIESVEVITPSGNAFAGKISYDEKAETATFTFKKEIPKGTAKLRLVFRGILNDRMHGFYRSSYEHDGKTRHLATTQFESTDARRALPCFDEPAIKAVFEVSLTVPSASTAISNTIPVDIKEHDGGYRTVRFAPTPPMSSYLLAFIVGDFEWVEKRSADGVLVRVFTTPGKKHQARFALDCAAKTISFFNKYFAIPYPLPVVDLIAIPDFSAGAMENWGAITYRESALLVDPEHSSAMNKQWVALVIAHELAHQWFGNLVTMEWWTHLWLNEGFASYIEYLAVDHIFPSWDMWTQFLQADVRPALRADALKHTHPIEIEVHHPSEIAAVFDAVSYSKGASIIRMLAEYLGKKDFRDGLRFYLKKHSYGNTETVDLWRAFEKVSGKPVAKMMAGWTGAGGYPVLSVSESASGLTIKQSRFFSSPLSAKTSREKTLWHVPVSFVAKGRAPKQVLMRTKSIRVRRKSGTWIKLNRDETSFHRTAYSPALRDILADAAKKKELKTRDRLGLIRDVFALSERGTVSAADALLFASNYAKETEYVVWAELSSSIAGMHSLLAHEPFLQSFERRALDIFSVVGRSVHWNDAPKNHVQALLKVLILANLGKYGDEKTVARAEKTFKAAKGNPDKIPADLRGLVYAAVARSGGKKEYAALMDMYKKAHLQEEKNRLGSALTNFKQKKLLEKTLRFAISKDVRPQDCTRMIAGVAVNPHGNDLAWKFIRENWKFFLERYAGSRELSHLIDPMAVSTSVARAHELARFFKKNPAPGTERTLAQVVEQIRANALWLKRNRKELASFLDNS